jgi:RNA polymerase sigma-70 factor (ECF subfamily)
MILNREEIGRLYIKMYGKLRGYALKITNDVEDAEDLVHDTMIKVLLNSNKFEVGTNFSAWVFTIMRNTFINGVRLRSNNIKKLELNESIYDSGLYGTSVLNLGYMNIGISDIMEIINRVSEKNRIPFMLYCEGFKMEEISDILGIPVGTVKTRIYLCRRSIMSEMSVD